MECSCTSSVRTECDMLYVMHVCDVLYVRVSCFVVCRSGYSRMYTYVYNYDMFSVGNDQGMSLSTSRLGYVVKVRPDRGYVVNNALG